MFSKPQYPSVSASRPPPMVPCSSTRLPILSCSETGHHKQCLLNTIFVRQMSWPTLGNLNLLHFAVDGQETAQTHEAGKRQHDRVQRIWNAYLNAVGCWHEGSERGQVLKGAQVPCSLLGEHGDRDNSLQILHLLGSLPHDVQLYHNQLSCWHKGNEVTVCAGERGSAPEAIAFCRRDHMTQQKII